VLEETVDIDAVQGCDALKLFVTATNVRTGKIRVFERRQLTIDALLAASCIPQVYRAVMIDGDPYWDGGMMGNPAIFPLIYGCGSSDVVIVQLDPIAQPATPRTASAIVDRVNEITFNANLMREMRAIAFALKLLDDDRLSGPRIERLKRLRVHLIGDEERMRTLGFVSKFNTDRGFLDYLKEAGRACAAAWLDKTFDAIGSRSSIDMSEIFL
jgi:NTE family protein